MVKVNETVVADTRSAVRILETASPPPFYLPPEAVDRALLEPGADASMCEWKGEAVYWSLRLPDTLLEHIGWSYPRPFPEYERIRDYFSFYPARIACYVGPHRVEPQPGNFYGGWVTPEVVGPFKGVPGSAGW